MADEATTAVATEEEPDATEETPSAGDLAAQYDYDDTGDIGDTAPPEAVEPDAAQEDAPDQPPSEDSDVGPDTDTVEDLSTDDAAEQPPTVEPMQLDMDLLARAARLGFQPADVRFFGPRLAQAVEHYEAVAAQAPPDTEPSDATDQSQSGKPAEEPTADLIDVKTMEEEGHEPTIINAFNSIQDRFQKYEERVGELTTRLEAALADNETRRQDDFLQTFDRTIQGWGEPFQEVFGTESHDKLDAKSPQAQNRQQLGQAMDIIAIGRKANGLPQLALPKLAEAARDMTFAAMAKDSARAEIADKVTKRSKTLISRPTHRTASSGSSRIEQAQKAVEQFYAERGIAPVVTTGEDDEILDGLL